MFLLKTKITTTTTILFLTLLLALANPPVSLASSSPTVSEKRINPNCDTDSPRSVHPGSVQLCEPGPGGKCGRERSCCRWERLTVQDGFNVSTGLEDNPDEGELCNWWCVEVCPDLWDDSGYTMLGTK